MAVVGTLNEHGKVKDLGKLPVQNEVLFVKDSVGYWEFLKARTPNCDKIGKTRKAYAHSYCTPPSVQAMFMGSVPQPENRCYWPYGRYSTIGEHCNIPVTLGNRGYHTYLVSNNILVDDTHYLGKDCVSNIDFFKHYICNWKDGMSSRELVKKFVEQVREPFYAFFLFTETHTPFMSKKGKRRRANATQIQGIEYLDGTFGKLHKGLKAKGLKHPTRVIITADHAEAWDKKLKNHGHRATKYHEYIKNGWLMRLLTVPLIVGKI